MQMVLVILGIIAWLLFLALMHMISRYKYTAKSVAVLALVAVPSVYFGNRLALHWFPGLAGSRVLYAISVPAGFGIWIGASFAVVMAWRQVKLGVYDKTLRSLRDKEATLLEEARRLSAVRASLRYEAPEEEPVGEDRGEISELERIIDDWQREPGKERIRSVRVQAWRDEIARFDRETLKRRRQDLATQRAGLLESSREAFRSDGEVSSDMEERIKQLEVQVALLDLRLLEIGPGETKGKALETGGKPGRGEGTGEQREEKALLREEVRQSSSAGRKENGEGPNPAAREAEVRETLDLVRREIDVWVKRRSEFLEKRITLN